MVQSRIDEIQSIEEHSERTERYSKGNGRDNKIKPKKDLAQTYYQSVDRYSSDSRNF